MRSSWPKVVQNFDLNCIQVGFRLHPDTQTPEFFGSAHFLAWWFGAPLRVAGTHDSARLVGGVGHVARVRIWTPSIVVPASAVYHVSAPAYICPLRQVSRSHGFHYVYSLREVSVY